MTLSTACCGVSPSDMHPGSSGISASQPPPSAAPSGFNTTGFTHATTVYAGSQPQNSNNPKSVSQYDVACFQAASH